MAQNPSLWDSLNDIAPRPQGCISRTRRRCSYLEQRAGQQAYVDPGSAIDEVVEPLSDNRLQRSGQHAAPLRKHARQVGVRGKENSMRSMAVQANRESILRHARENSASDEEVGESGEENPMRSMAVQANRESILRHARENAASDEEDAPGPLRGGPSTDTAVTGTSRGTNFSLGSQLRDLEYPKHSEYVPSARTKQVMEQAMSKVKEDESNSIVAMAQALSCAISDEFEALDNAWGTGLSNTAGERVATSLKRIAKAAEKKCFEGIPALATKTSKHSSPAVQDSDDMLEEECARLEAQIAAADLEAAQLTEALQNLEEDSLSNRSQIVRDLATRLPDTVGLDGAVLPDSIQGIVSCAEQCIQDLAPATIACQHLLTIRQESLEERSRMLCEAAEKSQCRRGIEGVRDALKRLQ